MRISPIVLAAAFGIALAAPAGSLAQDRHACAAAGKLDRGRPDRSQPGPSKALRASPEAHGGTLEAGDVIFF